MRLETGNTVIYFDNQHFIPKHQKQKNHAVNHLFCFVVTEPAEINAVIREKSIENIFFKKHLRGFRSAVVDEKIHGLNHTISKQVDCTRCANCCKKLEPGLEEHEIESLAGFRQVSADEFRAGFVAFDGEALFLKTKPCMFLDNCKCSVYQSRPAACAGYPHLDQKDMKYKKSLWENYAICPIVFNVVEELKKELGFTYAR